MPNILKITLKFASLLVLSVVVFTVNFFSKNTDKSLNTSSEKDLNLTKFQTNSVFADVVGGGTGDSGDDCDGGGGGGDC